MKPTPLDKDQIQNLVKEAVTDAVDFIESEISDERIKCQRYFDGQSDIGYEEGRSKVVSTKVRDTIRAIKPSLLRVFLNTDKPVEFVPKGPEDVAAAEQSTQYINWSFRELGGYKLLSDAFHDALVKRTGILKVYWDDYEKAEIHTYDNLTDEEFMLLANDSEVEVLEHSEEMEMTVDQMGMQVESKIHSCKISHTSKEGKLCVEAVPPEEFFVDQNARSLEDAYVVAHRTEMRVGDLIEMGYDWDDVADLGGLTDGSSIMDEEEFVRTGFYSDDSDQDFNDPSMKLVAVTEAYMRIDVDGTGIPVLHKIFMAGGEYKLLDYEVMDEIPFAVFEVDPEPHAFFGRSVADLIIDDQDASTAMLRGVLDNVALTNNPRLEINDDLVNIDDVLNNEIGAIVRVRQNGAIQPLAVPFIAGSTLPAMEYLDQVIEGKTGVSRASMGLDPEALQNTTATAAQITNQQAQGQIEVIARNLAESGLKRLFRLMLKLVIENSPSETMMRLNGQFVPVDPRTWNTAMDMTVNVGLGHTNEDVKLGALNQALQLQMQISQMPGPMASLTSLTQIRNTLADIMALGGYHNADRYFKPMNPQIEQQIIQQAMMQQQQQAQQQGPDPQAQAYLQAEQMKAQARMQTEGAKIQAQQQAKMAELQQRERLEMSKIQAKGVESMEQLRQRQANELAQLQMKYKDAQMVDDRERDKMYQDMVIKAAQILGVAPDINNVTAVQNAPRDENGNI